MAGFDDELAGALDRLAAAATMSWTEIVKLAGARDAHRHMLVELIAKLPNADFAEELVSLADAVDQDEGMIRKAAAYRAEIDLIVQQAAAIRRDRR